VENIAPTAVPSLPGRPIARAAATPLIITHPQAQRKAGSGRNRARLASTPRAASHLFPHRRSYRKFSSRERESFSVV
jgi:hypothetical protein